MPYLLLVATQGKRTDGPLRLCRLPSRHEVEVSQPNTPMQQVPASTPGSHAGQSDMARSIEQQIAQMERMADQHFAQDEAGRNAYLVGLLKTRLREYAGRFVRLEVRA